jgi:hypothetical protein
MPPTSCVCKHTCLGRSVDSVWDEYFRSSIWIRNALIRTGKQGPPLLILIPTSRAVVQYRVELVVTVTQVIVGPVQRATMGLKRTEHEADTHILPLYCTGIVSLKHLLRSHGPPIAPVVSILGSTVLINNVVWSTDLYLQLSDVCHVSLLTRKQSRSIITSLQKWRSTFHWNHYVLWTEHDCLLGCCNMYYSRSTKKFRKCFLPPSSGRWDLLLPTTQRNISEGICILDNSDHFRSTSSSWR